jgi:hypothetical protein
MEIHVVTLGDNRGGSPIIWEDVMWSIWIGGCVRSLFWIKLAQSFVSVGSNLSLRLYNDTVFHRRMTELRCNRQKVLYIKEAQRKGTQLVLCRSWWPWVTSHSITSARTWNVAGGIRDNFEGMKFWDLRRCEICACAETAIAFGRLHVPVWRNCGESHSCIECSVFALSVSPSLYVCLSLSVPLCLYVSLSLSVSLGLSMSLSLTVPLCLYVS